MNLEISPKELNRDRIWTDLELNQWLSSDQLRDIQFNRLKLLLAHAYNNVPYYRKLFNELGIDPRHLNSYEAFSQIPVLTKGDIQRNLEGLVATNYDRNQLLRDATGGSTGNPISFYRDPIASIWLEEAAKRFRRWIGYLPEDKIAFIWGADRDIPSAYPPNERWLNSFSLSPEKIDAFIKELLKWHPRVIRGYASSLYVVASYLQNQGVSLPYPLAQAIESSAEKLWDWQRSTIENAFACKVFNMYGSREVPSLGCECEFHTGLHLFSDLRLVEVIKDGRPAQAGEAGSIIITDLLNYGMPFIRYEIGDVGTLAETSCPCGRGFPLLKDIKGRITSTITTPDGRYIHGEYFTHLFYNQPGISAFQVRQRNLDTIEVIIQPATGFEANKVDRLIHQMKEHVGPQVTVTWHTVSEIPPAPSGKYHFTISEVPVDLSRQTTRLATENSQEQNPNLTPQAQSSHPRILMIADVPNWIFARHYQTLKRYLSDEFDFTLRYHGQPYSEDDFDLIYPLEWNLVQPQQIRNPAKYVSGIRSHLYWPDLDFSKFIEFLATHFQRVHVVSKRLYDIFAPGLPTVAYVTHGVDTTFFSPSTGADQSGHKIRLGWAGNRRTTANKGFEDIIEPLGNLPGVELVFCGYSDRNLSLDEMRSFYNEIDVYVCASENEGSNNSLLEAAAMERAIITTDNGTVPEYLKDNESALIVNRTLADFQEAVLRLRDDPALRAKLGKQARQVVVNRWDWQYKAENYRSFFRQALARQHHPSSPSLGETPASVQEIAPVSLAPEVVSYLSEAEASFQKGDLIAAGDALQQALDLAPDNPQIIGAYGNILLQQENFEAARRQFLKATVLQPRYVPAYVDLAVVLLYLERVGEAEAALEKALSIDPVNVNALKVWAQLCLNTERYAEGVKAYADILQHHPDDLDALLGLGRCYLEAEDLTSARLMYERVLAIDPDHAEARQGVELTDSPVSLSALGVTTIPEPAGQPQPSEKLRLLLVAHSFPPHNLGGTEIYTHNLASELSRRGHNVQVVYPHYDSSRPAGTRTDYRVEGVAVTALHLPPQTEAHQEFKNETAAAIFGQFLAGLQIDLVHFQHLIGFSASALQVCARHGIPTVMTVHDGWLLCQQPHFIQADGSFCHKGPETIDKCVHCFLGHHPNISPAEHLPEVFHLLASRRQFLQKVLSWIDTLVVPTNFMRQMFISHGFNHPHLVLSPLGLQPFQPILRAPYAGPLRFTFIGNIYFTKGVDLLLRAFKHLNHPQVELYLYGRMVAPDYFQRIVAELGPQPRVKYQGPYGPDDLPNILAQTDVAVIPSRAENYPTVIRECFQAGVPVIGPAVGGVPEIIKNGENGLLFETGNYEDLAGKLRYFAEKPAQVAAFQQRIGPVRSLAEDTDQLEEIYRQTLSLKHSLIQPEPPTVTIITPVFNKVDFTRQCLETLYQNTPESYNFEVIVVDNASTDDTGAYLQQASRRHPRLRLLTNPENLGFAKACNIGAQAATGKYLLFLNNDTEVQPGWLESLVALIEADPKVGIVGSKLLFPDGEIQHAGVVIVKDRILGLEINPWHVGYRQQDTEQFNTVRKYKAVTAACMLIRKDLFDQVRGFDEEYWNGYEDVDLCFKVGEAGYDIYYQPASVVIHHESKSGPERRVKERQNLERLQNKWSNRITPDYIRLDAQKIIPYRPASIIIVTYNSATTIRACLDSLLERTQISAKIIVVDNASTDNTPAILAEYEGKITTILNDQNKGFSAASNQGIRASNSDYLVLLNPDTVVTPGWLGQLLAHFKPGVGAVGPLSDYVAGLQKFQLYLPPDQPKVDHIPALLEILHRHNHGKAVETRLLIGFCLALSRQALDQVGLLDEDLFLGNDDLDLSWRLRQHGYKLLVATDTFIHHEGQVSFKTETNTRTTALVQESTDRLYAKLADYYGPDNIPSPEELWGISWFKPSQRHSSTQIELLEQSLTSIIILTHDQLEHTQLCLEGIEAHTPEPHELILVDNGSTDGTLAYLRQYQAAHPRVQIIANPENRGFAAGNNQGLAMAQGDFILLLNNDTIVTNGWLSRLLATFERFPEVGLLGPVSNYVSGPQQVKEANYRNLAELPRFAAEWAAKHRGQSLEFPRLVGFCLLARRTVIDRIGGLDESFGSGNFEDDDFCLRAAAAGFKARIVQDVFIHHTGNQTFNGAGIDYNQSLKRNWELFKTKWGLPAELPCGIDYRPYLQAVDPAKIYIPLPAAVAVPAVNGQGVVKSMAKTNSGENNPMTHNDILNQMIQAAQTAGRWDQAIQLLKEAVKYAPPGRAAAPLWNSLGVSYFQAGQRSEAEITFKQGLKADPENLDLLHNLAELYLQQEIYDQATEYLNRALRVDPDDIKTLLSLGQCAILLEAFEVALMAYRRVKTLAPETAGIDQIIQEIEASDPPQPYTNGHHSPQAEVDTAQETANQVLAAGQAALEQGDLGQAAKEFAWAAAQYPDLAAAHMALGTTLLAMGRNEAAMVSLRRVTELLPQLAAGHNQLGIALYRLKQLAEAEAAFQGANQLDPTDLEPLLNLVDLYRGQQRYEEASAAIKEALILDPNQIDVLVAFGFLCLELGDNEGAGMAWQRLQNGPLNHPGVQALGEAIGLIPVQ